MGVTHSARSIVFMFMRGLINFVVAIYISKLAVIISRKTDGPTVLVIAFGAVFFDADRTVQDIWRNIYRRCTSCIWHCRGVTSQLSQGIDEGSNEVQA